MDAELVGYLHRPKYWDWTSVYIHLQKTLSTVTAVPTDVKGQSGSQWAYESPLAALYNRSPLEHYSVKSGLHYIFKPIPFWRRHMLTEGLQVFQLPVIVYIPILNLTASTREVQRALLHLRKALIEIAKTDRWTETSIQKVNVKLTSQVLQISQFPGNSTGSETNGISETIRQAKSYKWCCLWKIALEGRNRLTAPDLAFWLKAISTSLGGLIGLK